MNTLEKAIKIWKDAKNTITDDPDEYHREECPLCDVYASKDVGCGKCPVKARTGKNGCFDTPFHSVTEAEISWVVSLIDELGEEDVRKARARFITAHEEEIKFLESLLSDGE